MAIAVVAAAVAETRHFHPDGDSALHTSVGLTGIPAERPELLQHVFVPDEVLDSLPEALQHKTLRGDSGLENFQGPRTALGVAVGASAVTPGSVQLGTVLVSGDRNTNEPKCFYNNYIKYITDKYYVIKQLKLEKSAQR